MPAPADQARRLALIIAESTYNDPMLQQLRAPGRDAADLGEVLGDPDIGGFDVDTLIDAPADQVKRHIHRFCGQARPGDLLLLYLSCHGVLDDRGRLYYAASDTERDMLDVTSVPAEWLNDKLRECRAREEILILDCCHSGAFAKGTKGEKALALQEKFAGRGKVVLTASRGTEYSFEGDTAVGDDVRSVFTRTVVEGLRSGAADRDRDGLVSVDDLYQYVYDEVRAAESRQTPERWVSNGEGHLVVARSVRGAIVEPLPLPEDLVVTLESPRMLVRETGVKVLSELLVKGEPGVVLTARQRLQQISEEDHPKIAAQARAALLAVEPAPGELTERVEPAEAGSPAATHSSGANRDGLPAQPGPQKASDLASDPGYVAALDAYFAGRWAEAVDLWRALAGRYPEDADAASRLADATRNRDLATWYEEAGRAEQQGDWGQVVAGLEKVVAVDETYCDACSRLGQARDKKQSQGVRADLHRLYDAQKWDAVVAAGERLAILDPDDADPDGLVAEARARLAEADLEARHDAGLRQMAGGDWEGARSTFAAIEAARPGYRDTSALLERAGQHLTRARQADDHPATKVADRTSHQGGWRSHPEATEPSSGPPQTRRPQTSRTKWTRPQDWVVLLAGVYAALCPLWTYSTGLAYTMVLLGVVTAAAALFSLAKPEAEAVQGLIVLMGALFILTPWVVWPTNIHWYIHSGYGALSWTAWVVGGVTLVAGFADLRRSLPQRTDDLMLRAVPGEIALVAGLCAVLLVWGMSDEGGAGMLMAAGVVAVVAALSSLAKAGRIVLGGLIAVAGLALVLSPWILGYAAYASFSWRIWIVGTAMLLAGAADLTMTFMGDRRDLRSLREVPGLAAIVTGLYAALWCWDQAYGSTTGAMYTLSVLGTVAAVAAALWLVRPGRVAFAAIVVLVGLFFLLSPVALGFTWFSSAVLVARIVGVVLLLAGAADLAMTLTERRGAGDDQVRVRGAG